jgi:hypothetical protein
MRVPAKQTPHQNIAGGSGLRLRLLHNRFAQMEAYVRWGIAVIYNRYKFNTVSLSGCVTAVLLLRPLYGGYRQ